jgi:glycosyltransferase involved in cell wall biosynthesis
MLAQTFPDADLFALSVNPEVVFDAGGRAVRTTFLDHPRLRGKRELSLPLMPLAWRLLGRGEYDLVLTSHHAFASSNLLARRGAAHLAYVHTPARYIWTPDLDGRGTSPLLAPARKMLGAVDRRSSRRLTGIAANSGVVAGRIHKYWDRDATVIHPPVDTEYFADGGSEVPDFLDLPAEYVLGLGRWIPYKNHAMVIDVAERLGIPVVIAGSGPLAAELSARAGDAGVPALVVEAPSREQVRELYRRASVLLFPTEEDFGIVPVEAMAAGTPVVAYARGGATETVEDGVSGILVGEHSVSAYADGVQRAQALDRAACVRRAARFGRERFTAEITAWVSAAADG